MKIYRTQYFPKYYELNEYMYCTHCTLYQQLLVSTKQYETGGDGLIINNAIVYVVLTYLSASVNDNVNQFCCYLVH